MSKSNDLADICFFMGKLAHEMNNRLGMILMTVDNALLADKVAQTDSQNYLQTIKDQSFIMSHIVEAIQVLTSIPAQKPKPVDINKLVIRSVELVKFLHAKKCNNFVINLTRNHPAVLVDKIHMEKSLLILLENTLLSVPKSGQISVTTEEKNNGSLVRINVSHSAPYTLKNSKVSTFNSIYSAKNEEILQLQLGYGLIQRIISRFNGTTEMSTSESTGISLSICLPTCGQQNNTNNSDYSMQVNSVDQDIVFSSQSGGIC